MTKRSDEFGATAPTDTRSDVPDGRQGSWPEMPAPPGATGPSGSAAVEPDTAAVSGGLAGGDGPAAVMAGASSEPAVGSAAIDGQPQASVGDVGTPSPTADAGAGRPGSAASVAGDPGPDGPVAPGMRAAVLEGLLFVSTRPLSLERIAGLLGLEISVADEEVRRLQSRLAIDEQRGLQVVITEEGVQLATKASISPFLTRLEGQRMVNLSLPALETLSIIAVKQPITRAEIEALRGVNSDGTVATLLEKKLITVVGEKPVPGRPRLYGTTQDFLYYFGLESLAQLPVPPDDALSAADLDHARRAGEGASTTTALEGMIPDAAAVSDGRTDSRAPVGPPESPPDPAVQPANAGDATSASTPAPVPAPDAAAGPGGSGPIPMRGRATGHPDPSSMADAPSAPVTRETDSPEQP